ncbi:acetyltransferase (GNAT) family protein [Algoriphagus ratkowskyi]|uniref:Acetyltransferase (GNAT) family protein n=1 Tax=Algoriphagus ratkowskyi TaxID=57028 RepID=A0A2W7REM9_9BACT|nr:GNAT family N-acetyltransferase [Algoriphagus ratkowskyi]PZX57586.1 acetyltransferase (GNAT) family protein [Algoriphagus ratkowskyi]TXD78865.1 GNAT family N-acetyltransferase [Algoriphagus ratkowskyi]
MSELFDISKYRLVRLSPQYEFKPFDCGDSDLNEFLLNDALDHMDQLLAVTYILEDDSEIIAFFSLLNDRISYEQFSKSSWLKKIQKIFVHGTAKRNYKSHPAMKIGRFGVSENYQSKGVGEALLDYIKTLFIDNNRTGCRFITLDAYNNMRSISFYLRNGFVLFTEDDKNADTRQMYFDLYPHKLNTK